MNMNDKQYKISVNIAEIFVLLTYLLIFVRYMISGKIISSFPYTSQILSEKLSWTYYGYYLYGLSILAVTPFFVLLTGFILFKYNKKWLVFVTSIVTVDEIYMFVNVIYNNSGEFSLYSLLGIISLILLINAVINNNEHQGNEIIVNEYKSDEQEINKLYKFDKKYSKELFKEKNVMIMLFMLIAVFALGIVVMVIIRLVQLINGELYTYILSILFILIAIGIYYLIFFNKRFRIKYKEEIVFLLGPIYQYYFSNGILYRRNKLLNKEEPFVIKSVSYNDEAYFCRYSNDEVKGKKKNRLVIPNYYPGIGKNLSKKTKLSLSKAKNDKLHKEYNNAVDMDWIFILCRIAALSIMIYLPSYHQWKTFLIISYIIIPILMYYICYSKAKKDAQWLKISLIYFLNNSAFLISLTIYNMLEENDVISILMTFVVFTVYTLFAYIMYRGIIASKKMKGDIVTEQVSDDKKDIEDVKLYRYDRKYAKNAFMGIFSKYGIIIIALIIISLATIYFGIRYGSSIIISTICIGLFWLVTNCLGEYKPYIFGYKYSYYRKDRWVYCVCKNKDTETMIYTDLKIKSENSYSYICTY